LSGHGASGLELDSRLRGNDTVPVEDLPRARPGFRRVCLIGHSDVASGMALMLCQKAGVHLRGDWWPSFYCFRAESSNTVLGSGAF